MSSAQVYANHNILLLLKRSVVHIRCHRGVYEEPDKLLIEEN
jgi:hypothetical protein